MKQRDLDEVLNSIIRARFPSNASRNFLPPADIIYKIIDSASSKIGKESNLLQLTGAFVVVGDIHGNIDDLIRIMQIKGYPPTTKYLFLGDYVDRGRNSIEVITFLYTLKLRFPECVYLLRGNHESQEVCETYGFKGEVAKRMPKGSFKRFVSSFKYLPIAAVINGQIFCVHAGISSELGNVKDLAKMQRKAEIPFSGVVTDLLWSDPDPTLKSGFEENERGAGYRFAGDAFAEFLRKNGLKMMIRSHELIEEGSEWLFSNTCLTVFSNTDYQGSSNSAAIAEVKSDSSVDVVNIKCLSKKERQKFRVIVPEFLLSVEIK